MQFAIAEKLGMTVAELHDRITPVELMGWNAYFTIKARREKEALRSRR